MKSPLFSGTLFWSWVFLLGYPLNVVANSAPYCKEVAFNVTGSALNRDLTGLALGNLTLLTAQLKADAFPRTIAVNGTQKIAGWYCQPNITNANNVKLQFFMSSITNNREAYTAQGGTPVNNPPYPPFKPEIYSWVRYANNLGYPTLALDHLGNGNSDHPDPITVVQAPYEISLYHDLVRQIKAGTTKQLPKAYSHLYYIGNSYGSELGNQMAQNYPTDFEAFILTGFSLSILPSLPGVTAQNPAPASSVNPAKYGNLPPGYLTSTNETTRTNSFFGSHAVVDFEQDQSHLFFTREDVVSVGQFVSAYVGIVSAPAYKGRVFVLTGENDQAFCGPGSSAINPNAMCGPLLKQTGSLFPNAEYNYQSVPKSGHALILHATAQITLNYAHAFLAGARFGA